MALPLLSGRFESVCTWRYVTIRWLTNMSLCSTCGTRIVGTCLYCTSLFRTLWCDSIAHSNLGTFCLLDHVVDFSPDLDFCCVFDLLGHMAPLVRTLGCFLCIVILKIWAASPPPGPLCAGHVCLPLVQRFAAGFCPETYCSWYCVYSTCCVIFGTLLVFSITCGSGMSTIFSTTLFGIRSSGML